MAFDLASCWDCPYEVGGITLRMMLRLAAMVLAVRLLRSERSELGWLGATLFVVTVCVYASLSFLTVRWGVNWHNAPPQVFQNDSPADGALLAVWYALTALLLSALFVRRRSAHRAN